MRTRRAIHRDLKLNILVRVTDGKPVPTIIDFGIAKAVDSRLSEKGFVTALGEMVGTPVYMSPEQAEASGLDIDTRADITIDGPTPLGRGGADCASGARHPGQHERHDRAELGQGGCSPGKTPIFPIMGAEASASGRSDILRQG